MERKYFMARSPRRRSSVCLGGQEHVACMYSDICHVFYIAHIYVYIYININL